jgi:hypothetical protein
LEVPAEPQEILAKPVPMARSAHSECPVRMARAAQVGWSQAAFGREEQVRTEQRAAMAMAAVAAAAEGASTALSLCRVLAMPAAVVVEAGQAGPVERAVRLVEAHSPFSL